MQVPTIDTFPSTIVVASSNCSLVRLSDETTSHTQALAMPSNRKPKMIEERRKVWVLQVNWFKLANFDEVIELPN